MNLEFFATAGGIPVHILDYKKGDKTLILLHGYLETMYIWSDFADLMAEHYRVITIDLPGHGLSGSAEVNSMDFDAGAVKGVLDKCGVSKAYIGGHSLGGYVTLACCRLFPEVFEKAILFNSNPYSDPPEKSCDREREIKIIEAGKLAALVSSSLPKMYKESNLRRLDEKIRETIEISETHDPQGIVASLRGMQQRPDSQQFLSETSIPFMFIGGDSDTILPLDKVKEMQTEFPKVKYTIIPETGHNSFVEDPASTAQAVIDFLR